MWSVKLGHIDRSQKAFLFKWTIIPSNQLISQSNMLDKKRFIYRERERLLDEQNTIGLKLVTMHLNMT